jgi:hypothetical protein
MLVPTFTAIIVIIIIAKKRYQGNFAYQLRVTFILFADSCLALALALVL